MNAILKCLGLVSKTLWSKAHPDKIDDPRSSAEFMGAEHVNGMKRNKLKARIA